MNVLFDVFGWWSMISTWGWAISMNNLTSCLSSQLLSTIQWFLVDGSCSFFFFFLQPILWASCSQMVSTIQWSMVDGLWLMVTGFWLMVYVIFRSQEVSMNILPKLTDGLNHPISIGWWFMFLFLQPRAEHPALIWSQRSIGLWLMVYPALTWFQPTHGIWLKVLIDGFWLMVYVFYRSWAWTMNILPKLTDGLNHPMVFGWWFMFFSSDFFCSKDREHTALRWSQPPSGLWLMVYGWWFFGWCFWKWKLRVMYYL